MATQTPHPRMSLNNELQAMYGNPQGEHVRWEIWSTGSPNSPMWHASIYIDDMCYGSGSAATKGAAQDQAALEAYNKLRRERFARGH
ncbi:hypothetical protein M405DRAFT_803548 [Rhizopogon salebrosus TDB-379]|nr:hypothetical protein M405DRAFT_803548 [Rhizopogon salebrosus TDB-379]